MISPAIDPVGVVLIPLVLFRKNLFEPMGLLVSGPFIHEGGLVGDDELLAATITSQGTHFLEIRRFLSDLTLFYCHRPHLLNFSDFTAFRSFAFRVRAFAAALEALMALSLRSFAVKTLARANPPRLPISAMTFAIVSLSLMA